MKSSLPATPSSRSSRWRHEPAGPPQGRIPERAARRHSRHRDARPRRRPARSASRAEAGRPLRDSRVLHAAVGDCAHVLSPVLPSCTAAGGSARERPWQRVYLSAHVRLAFPHRRRARWPHAPRGFHHGHVGTPHLRHRRDSRRDRVRNDMTYCPVDC